jgi:predicted negative regulator of RcsB-dependent stress response
LSGNYSLEYSGFNPCVKCTDSTGVKHDPDKAYQKAIAKGDRSFSKGDFKKAKTHYKKAVSIAPFETYPKERLYQIDLLVE